MISNSADVYLFYIKSLIVSSNANTTAVTLCLSKSLKHYKSSPHNLIKVYFYYAGELNLECRSNNSTILN